MEAAASAAWMGGGGGALNSKMLNNLNHDKKMVTDSYVEN